MYALFYSSFLFIGSQSSLVPDLSDAQISSMREFLGRHLAQIVAEEARLEGDIALLHETKATCEKLEADVRNQIKTIQTSFTAYREEHSRLKALFDKTQSEATTISTKRQGLTRRMLDERD